MISGSTFINPVVAKNGADPFIYRHKGKFYRWQAVADRFGNHSAAIAFTVSRTLSGTGKGRRVKIFDSGQVGRVWAPEGFYDLETDSWYVHFAGGVYDENLGLCPAGVRDMEVLVRRGEDPLGPYEHAGKVIQQHPFEREGSTWAIDGHVMKTKHGLFYVWSAPISNEDPSQRLCIAEMSDPTRTIGAPKTLLFPNKAEGSWHYGGIPGEWKNGVLIPFDKEHPDRETWVLEGPQSLEWGKWRYVFFSGGSTAHVYGTGYMRQPIDAHPMRDAWTVFPRPILAGTAQHPIAGHGAPVQALDGSWWFPHHRNERGQPDLNRATFLTNRVYSE